ncbi:MAG: hypothetical protein HY268_13635 [Deltaproteobacteria bacterium]|nr:hypothetical protein [Deltaproteobacteria bacterium]
MAKRPRKRRRLLSKLLLVLAYAAVFIFIGAIFFMKNELRRIGFFGTESTTVPPPTQSLPASSPSLGTALQQDTKPPSRSGEDLTRDDKKHLDDVLRARGGKP